MAKEVTQDRVRECFNYINGHFFPLSRNRQAVKRDMSVGYKTRVGYHQIGLDGKLYYRHRLVFLYHKGFLPEFIDHINGDKSDDRIENLRECNKQENAINSKPHSDNKTGYKNVGFNKSNNNYRVRMFVKGTRIEGGSFDTLEEASLKAKELREEHHGIFNFDKRGRI